MKVFQQHGQRESRVGERMKGAEPHLSHVSHLGAASKQFKAPKGLAQVLTIPSAAVHPIPVSARASASHTCDLLLPRCVQVQKERSVYKLVVAGPLRLFSKVQVSMCMLYCCDLQLVPRNSTLNLRLSAGCSGRMFKAALSARMCRMIDCHIVTSAARKCTRGPHGPWYEERTLALEGGLFPSLPAGVQTAAGSWGADNLNTYNRVFKLLRPRLRSTQEFPC